MQEKVLNQQNEDAAEQQLQKLIEQAGDAARKRKELAMKSHLEKIGAVLSEH